MNRCDVFLTRPQHLKKTLTNTILEDSVHVRMEHVRSCRIHFLKANTIIIECTHPPPVWLLVAFRVMVDDFCSHLCSYLLMCVGWRYFAWNCWPFFLHVIFTPGYCFFSLSDPHTHLASSFRWRASLHTEMFVDGGWCWCWCGTNQSSHHPTHPVNHLQLTPIHHTYTATMQGFCADVHRLTMEAIPRLLLENGKNRRTVDAIA